MRIVETETGPVAHVEIPMSARIAGLFTADILEVTLDTAGPTLAYLDQVTVTNPSPHLAERDRAYLRRAGDGLLSIIVTQYRQEWAKRAAYTSR